MDARAGDGCPSWWSVVDVRADGGRRMSELVVDVRIGGSGCQLVVVVRAGGGRQSWWWTSEPEVGSGEWSVCLQENRVSKSESGVYGRDFT